MHKYSLCTKAKSINGFYWEFARLTTHLIVLCPTTYRLVKLDSVWLT